MPCAHYLLGVIAGHSGNLDARLIHCRRDAFYARITEDQDVQAASLTSPGMTYYYAGKPAQFAAACETALALDPDIAPLLKAKAHAYLAVARAQGGPAQNSAALTLGGSRPGSGETATAVGCREQ